MQVFMSVANLAPRLRAAESGDVQYLGILNRHALARGERVYSALGGAVELTEQGKGVLCTLCDVQFTEDGNDARFVLDDVAVERAERFFARPDPELFEVTPDRELREELGRCEFSDQREPILAAELLKQLRSRFVIAHVQPCSGMVVSRRAPPGMLSHRLFLLHEVIAPQVIVDQLQRSAYVHLFTPEQVARTAGGRRDVLLPNGDTLGSNIFLF